VIHPPLLVVISRLLHMMANGQFGSGPLWFLETLLIFSLAYMRR
jgi:hypothetical protein